MYVREPGQRTTTAAAPRAKVTSPTVHAAPSIHRFDDIGIGVVQRAIGYEYEIGDAETFRKRFLLGDAPLTKGAEVLPARDGVKTTADDPPTGSQAGRMSDLEMIIDPPIDDRDARAGRQQAEHRLGVMAEIVAEIRDAVGDDQHGEASAAALGGTGGVYIRGGAGFASGSLQVTAGLESGALEHVRTGAALNRLRQQDESEDGTFGLLTSVGGETAAGVAIAEIRDAGAAAATTLLAETELAADGPAIAQLGAVIGLLFEPPYNTRGEGGGPYAKATAGALMARTDFASLLGTLSIAVQGALQLREGAWIPTLIAEFNELIPEKDAVTAASRVFPHAFGDGTSYDITLGSWWGGLVEAIPRDLLTASIYHQRHGWGIARLWAWLRGHGTGLESMGSYGDRTDAPTGARRRAIFEFRTVGTTYLTDLVNRGLAFYDYVLEAHGRRGELEGDNEEQALNIDLDEDSGGEKDTLL